MATSTTVTNPLEADCAVLGLGPCSCYQYQRYVDICYEEDQKLRSKEDQGPTNNACEDALLRLRASAPSADCLRFVLRASDVLKGAAPPFWHHYGDSYWPAYGVFLGRLVVLGDINGKTNTRAIWADLAEKFRKAGTEQWAMRARIMKCFKVVAHSCHACANNPRRPHYKPFWRAFEILWGYLMASFANSALRDEELAAAICEFVALWYELTSGLVALRWERRQRQAGPPQTMAPAVAKRLLSIATPLLDMLAGIDAPYPNWSDWSNTVAKLADHLRPWRQETRRIFDQINSELNRRANSEPAGVIRTNYEAVRDRLVRKLQSSVSRDT